MVSFFLELDIKGEQILTSSLLSQDVGILIFFSPFELLGGHTPHADELRIEDQKTTTSVSSR
jgi:hypothetical protein